MWSCVYSGGDEKADPHPISIGREVGARERNFEVSKIEMLAEALQSHPDPNSVLPALLIMPLSSGFRHCNWQAVRKKRQFGR